uniref:Uncharacterized protein n=1 Tax=Oncorhynchus mykiss TaxID=8022 RepID=A0A8C7R6B7_ONCMY
IGDHPVYLTMIDIAIMGLYDNKAFWASKPGGILAAIYRGSLLQEGVTVGGRKVAMVPDHMTGTEKEIIFVDLRTKRSESLSLMVALASKALVSSTRRCTGYSSLKTLRCSMSRSEKD